MIAYKELEEDGLDYHIDTNEWVKDNLKLTIDDGIITFVRENENYHGINVRITSIEQLRIFLTFRR